MEEKIKKLTKLSEDNQEDYNRRLLQDMPNRKEKIIGVKYESKYQKGTFEGREYSYFTKLNVEVGDIVICPTKYGASVGIVSKLNIPEEEIEPIKKFMKEILVKYNKESYLNGKLEIEEVINYGA